MKNVYHFIAIGYLTLFIVSRVTCQNPDQQFNTNQSNAIKFSDFHVPTLSNSPRVKNVLLGTDVDVLALRLKERYDKMLSILRTDYSSTIDGFECLEKNASFLVILAIAIICYIVYSIFNFIVNYSTLVKTRGRKGTKMSMFYALSQAMTGRRIFKYHQQEIEKLHFHLQVKIIKIEEKIQTLEEAERFYKLLSENKKVSEFSYDYVQPTEKFSGNPENTDSHSPVNIRNSENSGSLTPVNDSVV